MIAIKRYREFTNERLDIYLGGHGPDPRYLYDIYTMTAGSIFKIGNYIR